MDYFYCSIIIDFSEIMLVEKSVTSVSYYDRKQSIINYHYKKRELGPFNPKIVLKTASVGVL